MIEQRGQFPGRINFNSLTKREWRAVGRVTILSKLQELLTFRKMSASGYRYWHPEGTRRWGSAYPHVAAQWGIEMWDEPDGAYALHDQLSWEVYGEQGQALPITANYFRALRETGASGAAGLCSFAARSRVIFPEPSMGITWFRGYPIDYPKKIALLAALGTKIMPLGVNQYEWGDNQVRGRLALHASGEADWPFVANRPKPNQPGSWFVVVGDVAPNLQSFESDDFNLQPGWFPSSWIIVTYDAFYSADGQVPDAIRGEVEYYRDFYKTIGLPIPVRPELVFSMVYGSPLVRNLEEDKVSYALLRRQKMMEKYLDIIAPRKRHEQFVKNHSPKELLLIAA